MQWQFRNEDRGRDRDGNTPFHQNCLEEDANVYDELTEEFEEKPIMINAVNKHGETPFMLAADPDLRRSILEHRLIPVGNSEPSRNPMYFHNFDLFGTLVKLTEKEDVARLKMIQSDLLGLHTLDWRRFSKDMQQHCGDKKGETPLHIAAKLGNGPLVAALLELNMLHVEKKNNDGRTALHVACYFGCEDVVRILLPPEEDAATEGLNTKNTGHHHISMNTQDKMGKTALHLAALRGNCSTVRTLLRHSQTNVNQRDAKGRTAVFYAISAKNDQNEPRQLVTLKEFLSNRLVDVSTPDFGGESILHRIAKTNSLKAAELVLKHPSINLLQQEHVGKFSALHMAIIHHSFEVAKFLVSIRGIDINQQDKNMETPLHLLCGDAAWSIDDKPHQKRLMREVATLILSRDDVNLSAADSRSESVLVAAARTDNVFLTSVLMQHPNVNVNESNEKYGTPLYQAASCDSEKVTALLLSAKNVLVNEGTRTGRTALHCAASENNSKVAALILARDDVKSNKREQESDLIPLHLAALYDCADVAKMLLDRPDADVNARSRRQATPLHCSVRHRGVRVAEMLLARDDVLRDARDELQWTPLHFTARKDFATIAEILLSHDDVDANARSADGGTPLHVAAGHNSVRVAEMLLARDDVLRNARDERQRTPLHLAAEMGSEKVAALLLALPDVDIDVPDIDNDTPIMSAVFNKRGNVAKLLAEALNDRDSVCF